jgi:hypothetical protein
MNKILNLIYFAIVAQAISGCAASSTSPVGVNCNYEQEKPFRDLPVDCQGR